MTSKAKKAAADRLKVELKYPRFKKGDWYKHADVPGYDHDEKLYKVVEGPYRRDGIAYYSVEADGRIMVCEADGMISVASDKAYELLNSPYLVDAEKPSKLVRNYNLLPPSLDKNILDYIECASQEQAKWFKGLLWNAFAAGRQFEKAAR